MVGVRPCGAQRVRSRALGTVRAFGARRALQDIVQVCSSGVRAGGTRISHRRIGALGAVVTARARARDVALGTHTVELFRARQAVTFVVGISVGIVCTGRARIVVRVRRAAGTVMSRGACVGKHDISPCARVASEFSWAAQTIFDLRVVLAVAVSSGRAGRGGLRALGAIMTHWTPTTGCGGP